MIMLAEHESARWLMRANDLREKGRNCSACGRGFIPNYLAHDKCPTCRKVKPNESSSAT